MRSSFRAAPSPPRRWPLPPPTQKLLQAGGDGRVLCDPATGLTGYGSAVTPRPHAIELSSCTASSISAEGFAAADAARTRLAQAALDGDVAAEMQRQGTAIRAAIADHFDLPPGAGVVLAASGTDAELLVLALVSDRKVINVLVAPGETGSGVPQAAGGCHFSEQSGPRRGTPVDGLGPVVLRTVAGRDAAGRVRSSREVMADYAEAITDAEAENACALLHLLDGSKTGYVLPDPEELRRVAAWYPGTVRVVVDACQGRSDPVRIAGWVQAGWIVLVTGSKFYGGPPFSGALLLPAGLMTELSARPWCLPKGLGAYTTRADWPTILVPSRDLPEPGNAGLLLRWQAALTCMAVFRATPPALRAARLAKFATGVRRLIASRPELRLLETPCSRSLFSFAVLRDGRPLSLDEAKRVHRLLNADLSGWLPGLSPAETRLARTLCLIGQPVALPGQVVLRIAAGARRGSARWAHAQIALDKLRLILCEWSRLMY